LEQASVEQNDKTVRQERSGAPGAKRNHVRTPLLVALALPALAALAWGLAGVLRVESANGTLVVEVNDPEVEARVKSGKLVLMGTDGKVRYTLSASEGNKTIKSGPYKIRVEGADGLKLDTSEFTLEKGGKVTVRVTAVAKEPPAVDPDRLAAEWVLSLGGTVRVNGEEEGLVIRAAADLPRKAFRLTWADVTSKRTVGYSDLSQFKGCKNLMGLVLNRTKARDSGMAYFKDCKDLTDLDLGDTQVGDSGLAYFKGCKSLMLLNLWGTQVTNAGLAHFQDCKGLKHLDLNGTKVSDSGVGCFKDCKNLVYLALSSTKVTNTGLAHFKNCKSLRYLHLWGLTSVSDSGLAHFKDCKEMTDLGMSHTQLSDSGLACFKDCKKLTSLWIDGTKVSDLSPLKGLPLTRLFCDFKPERDADILRSIKTLETINGKPAKDFWKEVDAGKK
jgi:uncharacterized membrane protein